jgi:predicted lipoprotein with Yx(FWY)xxD motif
VELGRRLIRWGLPLVLVAVAGAGAAMAATAHTHTSAATVKVAKSGKFGTILVGSNGRTLYRYTLDRKGVNRCSSNATCNKYWPPLLVKPAAKPTVATGANAGLVGTIKATHGMRQVTYAGFPLYFFAGDKKAGQTTGQGFESQWYVVNTAGAFVKRAVATPAPAPTTTGSSSGGGDAWG